MPGRKTWQRWHKLAGFNIAVLLTFIFFTGTLSVISHELDYLTNPAVRGTPVAIAKIDWGKAYEAVSAYIPRSHRIAILNAPEHQGFALQAIVQDVTEKRYRVFIDPVSYQITGTGSWFNWQTTLRRLHRHLMMPLWFGITLVSATSVLLLVSLVSGWIMTPRWWQHLWQLPRTRNARLFWTDLHRLSGLWSSWLLLIITLTGLWYLAEQNGLKATYPKNAQTEHNTIAVTTDALKNALQQIHTKRPSFTPSVLIFPARPSQGIRIEGRERGVLVRDRANNIIADPVSGEWLSQRFTTDLGVHQRISEAADPLHFGTWAGYSSKIAYFIFGVILTSLCITGTYLVALREVAVKSSVPQRRLLWCGLKKMGAGAWISGAIIALSLGLMGLQIARY